MSSKLIIRVGYVRFFVLCGNEQRKTLTQNSGRLAMSYKKLMTKTWRKLTVFDWDYDESSADKKVQKECAAQRYTKFKAVNEKLDSELVHEKNAAQIPRIYDDGSREVLQNKDDLFDVEQESRNTMYTTSSSPHKTIWRDEHPIKYVSECTFKPVTVPVRFRETLLIKTDTNKMTHNEEVFYETKFYPSKWSETMFTHVKRTPRRILTEAVFPIEQDYHYISFENQQAAASACKLRN